KRDNVEPKQLRYWTFFTAVSQIFGILMVFFTGYWNATWNGGYTWGPNVLYPNGSIALHTHDHHYHGTFMTVGLVFMQGEAILVYRLLRHENKAFSKTIHAIFHGLTFLLFITGLAHIIQSKNNQDVPRHFYTAHSWVGLMVMIAFILQYVAGFVNFAYPKTSPAVRKWFISQHRVYGLVIFGVSVAQALMGISQDLWIIIIGQRYSGFGLCYSYFECAGGQGIIFNLNVLFIIFYAVSVVCLATSPKYAREKTLDES
uniref:Cytochrome b561 domain-containing protein n=1 Tax=Plectus sambesii TaxID=2011161 RepID=A0A914VLH4_9BILA